MVMTRARLDPCASCKGFVPSRATVCPHCKVARSARAGVFARLHLSALGGAVGGGALAVTLMACYGMAPGDYDADDPDARSLADAQVGDSAASDAGRDAARDADASDARTDGGEEPDAGDAEADAGP